jgi:alcohol dehydrogenase class IV
LLNNIEQALKEVENDQAREKMQFGAYLAGISLFNAGSGPAGALSYPLGVVCKVPHGIAGGFILPYLLEFNVKNGYYGYFEIADELAIQGENEREKCEKLVAYLFDLYDRLDVWALAKKYDIKTNNSALSEYIDLLQGAFDQNPVNFTPSDGKTILNKIF